MIDENTLKQLERRGERDKGRLDNKIKEHLRKNIKKYIMDEALITGDGKKKVKIQIKNLELPEFKFSNNDGGGVGGGGGGQGQPGPQSGQPGGPGDSPGEGDEAGEGSADHAIEAEVDIDQIVELAFQELGLPDIDDSIPDNLMSESLEFDEIRKCGPIARLDRRRTLIQNMKRNAQGNQIGVGGIRRCDLRFRSFEETMKRSNRALIISMMDVSGSMNDEKKFLVRVSLWWIKKYLEKIYEGLEFAFIIHDTEAEEVDEEKFFKASTGGGTALSSAMDIAIDLIEHRYDACTWNIYCFHYSDGENLDTDNPKALASLNELLMVVRRFYYGQVGTPTGSNFLDYLKKDGPKVHNLITAGIKNRDEVADAIERFLNRRSTCDDE